MATYGISALVDQFNKQLNTKQRMSSLFSEAPVIAGKVLRRGTEILLNEVQYLQQKSKIDVLINAGAIKVRLIGEGGSVRVENSSDFSKKPAPPVVSVVASGPASGPLAPGVASDTADMVVDAVKEVVAAVAPELSAPVAAVADAVQPEANSTEKPKRGRPANK